MALSASSETSTNGPIDGMLGPMIDVSYGFECPLGGENRKVCDVEILPQR